MAQTAIIHTISPFDATKGATIGFTWNGNQIYKVRCIIKENESNSTVFDSTVDSMKQQFELGGTSGLSNGKYYIAYITVFDIDGTESEQQSIGTPFYCYTTPTFDLSISENDVIKASVYSVGISYSQTENELLNSYKITLYSYSKQELQNSGTIYDTSDLTYIISRLENAKQYYIRAIGETIHGFPLDTGYILFSVSYTQAQIFSPLEANNLADIGAIEIKSNVLSALATAEKDVTYIDGTMADLRDNSITFEAGFTVSGDHTSIYCFNKPNLNSPIINFTGEKTNVDIIYREGIFNTADNQLKAYFELQDSSCGRIYTIESNLVDIPDDDHEFALLVNREAHNYEMKVVLIEKGKD